MKINDLFEMIKEYIDYSIARHTTVELGEVANIDPDNNLVKMIVQPDAVLTPWLPLSVGVYGVRGVPNIGDQGIVLYMDNTPMSVVGFTYNNIDLTEKPVNTQQFRLTKGTGGAQVDILLDGTTGRVTISGVVNAASGVATKTKAGTPSDADFPSTPSDGTLVIDTTAHKLWARMGGIWKSVTLT